MCVIPGWAGCLRVTQVLGGAMSAQDLWGLSSVDVQGAAGVAAWGCTGAAAWSKDGLISHEGAQAGMGSFLGGSGEVLHEFFSDWLPCIFSWEHLWSLLSS